MELKLAVKAEKTSDGFYSGWVDLILSATKTEKKLFFKLEKNPFLNLGFKLSVYLDDQMTMPFLESSDDEFGVYKASGLALLLMFWEAIIPQVLTMAETPGADSCAGGKTAKQVFDKNLMELISNICSPEEKNHVGL